MRLKCNYFNPLFIPNLLYHWSTVDGSVSPQHDCVHPTPIAFSKQIISCRRLYNRLQYLKSAVPPLTTLNSGFVCEGSEKKGRGLPPDI
mmetsp:Transcript_68/g.147  ORF Transcript_68/g.147 Transcript_68/m.147 type:complete len:89 (-) Transcript_68:1819-2085(-)